MAAMFRASVAPSPVAPSGGLFTKQAHQCTRSTAGLLSVRQMLLCLMNRGQPQLSVSVVEVVLVTAVVLPVGGVVLDVDVVVPTGAVGQLVRIEDVHYNCA